MSKVLDQINQANLEILCILIAIIAILLAIIVIGDFLISKFKYSNKKIIINKETKTEEEKLSKTTPIKEIKYVHENSEIEKAKAQLQLQTLKQELMAKEKKILEEQAAIKKRAEELKVNTIPTQVSVAIELPETKDTIIEEPVLIVDKEEPVQEDFKVKETPNVISEELNNIEKIEEVNKITNLQNTSNQESFNQKAYIDEEETAIISINELKEASANAYTDEQMAKYDDEGNEPITLQEVEELANTMKLKPIELREFELPEEKVENQKSFESTPYISPVFGTENKIENRITIEQTANYDKLNEEIKKTNEFLVTLKELRKNLD